MFLKRIFKCLGPISSPWKPGVVFMIVTMLFTFQFQGNGNRAFAEEPEGMMSVQLSEGKTLKAWVAASDLSEKDIASGGRAIVVGLIGNTWVSDIAFDKNKIRTLLKAFKADSEIKQWGLVQSALGNLDPADIVILSVSREMLIFILPAVPEYDIVNDQTIRLTIPKSLVETSDTDIDAGSFVISSTKADSHLNLKDAIEDGTIDDMLKNTSPHEIYIDVPKKHVTSMQINRSPLGDMYITIIDVFASDSVYSVKAVSDGLTRIIDTYSASNGIRKFTIGFGSDLPNGADVTISTLDDKGRRLQPNIIEKVSNGVYKYTEAPKVALDGSYTLYKLMTDENLLKNILQYYRLADLTVGVH